METETSATSEEHSSAKGAGEGRGTVIPKPSRRPWWARPARFLRGLAVYVAFVALLMWGMPVALSYFLHTEYPMAAITSGSMWPALKVGDLILIQGVKSSDLKIGDIVVYTNPKGFTIHRITALNPGAGTLTTKGDANNVSDAPVKFSDVIGRTLAWSNGNPVRMPRLGFISIMVSKKVRN